jgi:hypothetical protein
MKGSRAIGVTLDNELIERCDRLRLAGRLKHWSLKRFREMVFEMGMDKYELMFPPRKAPEENAGEDHPVEGAKIIPFPGGILFEPDNIQNALDDFLWEMGYIE